MFYLTVKSGTQRGISYPIGPRGIVIGRAASCDIPINDPIVSRRHCEVVVENGRLRLHDLGSSNTTLVNGQAVRESELALGDEIALGRTVFMLTTANPLHEAPSKPGEEEQTLSLDESDSVFKDERVPHLTAEGRPETIQDLAALYSLGRALSTALCQEDLLRILASKLMERFHPTGMWVAHVGAGPENLVLLDLEGAGVSTSSNAPLETMHEAATHHRALLAPVVDKQGGQIRALCTMVAPVSIGGEVLAVLALQIDSPGQAYGQSDLEFFMAAAQQAAPFFVTVEQVERLRRDNALLSKGTRRDYLVGECDAFKRVQRELLTAGQSSLNVLILGETGTGKELAARYVHECSSRSDGPFIAVNCAAIPQELFESELFGHEKGAFTGADRRHAGRFEQADGGTLFLDEIGDLSLPNQARILRAIELGVFHRLGAEKETSVDVRIVAATNRGLDLDVREGRFRSDLYHRLRGFGISLPPLRERSGDIPLLAQHFFEIARERAKRPVRGIAPEVIEYLQTQTWPGNIRELRSCVERAVHVATTDLVQINDLQVGGGDIHADEILTLTELERRHVTRTLERFEGNISAAARALGVSRNTLYAKISETSRQPG